MVNVSEPSLSEVFKTPLRGMPFIAESASIVPSAYLPASSSPLRLFILTLGFTSATGFTFITSVETEEFSMLPGLSETSSPKS